MKCSIIIKALPNDQIATTKSKVCVIASWWQLKQNQNERISISYLPQMLLLLLLLLLLLKRVMRRQFEIMSHQYIYIFNSIYNIYVMVNNFNLFLLLAFNSKVITVLFIEGAIINCIQCTHKHCN